MAAYVLARSDMPWMRWVYLLVVVCFAVPVHAVLVPLYQELSAAGMLNSRLAIVLPYVAYGIPFTTVLFYAFFLDFPRELEDAARLDNCNRVQIFFRVILPLSGPALASASIFQAVFIWNEFLLALLMLTRSRPEDAAGRHLRADQRVHRRLAGGDGRAVDRHRPDRDDLLLRAEILRPQPGRALGASDARRSERAACTVTPYA